MGFFKWGCERGNHYFEERFDEEVVKMHNDLNQTVVKYTYLFDICTRCGKIVYPKEEEEVKEKEE